MVDFGVASAEKPDPLTHEEIDVFRVLRKVADGTGDGKSVSFIDVVLGKNLQNWSDGQL